MSVSLDTAVSSLTTNKRRVGALKSLGVVTVRDALTYYPFRVTDPVPARPIREARIGMPIAFAATVQALRVVPMNARRGFRLQAVVADDSGTAAQLVFFSYKKQYVDWVSMRLRQGARVVIAGVPSEFNGQLQFTHPEILTIAPAPAPQPGPGLPGTEPDPWQPGTGQPPQPPQPLPPTQPSSLKFDADSEEQALRRVCRPRPVYHATSRISSEHIHESIMGFLDALDDHAIPDILPESVRAAGGYLHRAEAFRAVHNPDTTDDFRRAIDTLRYEEAFVSQTALVRTRHSTHQIKAHNCAAGGPLVERFIGSLPFELTGGQRAVIDDVTADMQRDWPMQRLLQGEVGSGKTVVAVAAMLQAAGAGHQAVLVAPTQVLAEQHAETIGRMVAKIGTGADPDSEGAEPTATTGEIPVILLTGGMKLAARRRALATIASGTPCIVVATHAAFSKTFQAPDLALVVIDEQHRFGVEQRETLRHRYDVAPHLLVMTATPIPRTAAMTWFGDLDLSWLTELPGGRKPIRTIVVPEADAGTMGRMFAHIRSRVDAGERAYIVCARIDADDDPAAESGSGGSGSAGGHGPGRGLEDRGYDAIDMFDEPDGDESTPKPPLHSVTEIADRLAALPQFRGLTLATLTGRDDDETKTRVMAEFADGTTPILVATTVIEVGVDVPQASCIVIFDADRFGLSQLHQLRGRVGRGGTNSWAFLISRAEPDSIAAQRLAVIQGTLDGAEIAQADLELRGAGDVLGDAQSGGKSSLKLLRVIKDAKLIERARADAERVLEADPELAHEPQLAGAVLDFTRGNGEFLTST
ncbi:ATP-dependent DNA helicase RecG [Bifidobacterium vespertilionis]|uniref:ATP-dependent DNA helicase RecG n=1 Tax=Bifidobacterium vespertilionis TaxID=2562524 RepID=UPI001BDD8B56|nr:ATP-dependent DNA helicase RecG [Bifidobacterium vespertilionis]MBT1179910.1 ATP-dependent DNA helicase RecG [Bifidobacterium vespertilionis]